MQINHIAWGGVQPSKKNPVLYKMLIKKGGSQKKKTKKRLVS